MHYFGAKDLRKSFPACHGYGMAVIVDLIFASQPLPEIESCKRLCRAQSDRLNILVKAKDRPVPKVRNGTTSIVPVPNSRLVIEQRSNEKGLITFKLQHKARRVLIRRMDVRIRGGEC